MKKILCVLIMISLIFAVVGCATKTLTCDHCGKEVKVKESSNMDDSWIIYCDKCNEQLFGNDPLLSGK